METLVLCIGLIGTIQVVKINDKVYFFNHPLRVECEWPGRSTGDDYVHHHWMSESDKSCEEEIDYLYKHCGDGHADFE
jgi:hypothetical protein